MKYISMTAMFDDMDTAEAAARRITWKFPGVKSVKLHYHRQEMLDADSFTDVSLTAANQTNYVNVGYGVIPPQGAAPMFAVYQPVNRKGGHGYSQRKVKMTVVTPHDKVSALTSCLINSGGHYVQTR